MMLDCANAQEKTRRNLVVGKAEADQPCHLLLAPAQASLYVWAAGRAYAESTKATQPDDAHPRVLSVMFDWIEIQPLTLTDQ